MGSVDVHRIVIGVVATAVAAAGCTATPGDDAPEDAEPSAQEATSEPDPSVEAATTTQGDVEVVAGEWELFGVSPDETVLRLIHTYGGCETFLGWEIDEAADAVTVTARSRDRRPTTDGCEDVLYEERRVVELDAPLGDRALEGCGQPDCRDHDLSMWGQDQAGEVAASDDALIVNGRTQNWSLDPDDGSVRWTSDGGGVWAIAGPSTAFRMDVPNARFEVLDAVSGERRGSRIDGRPLGVAGDVVLSCRDRRDNDPPDSSRWTAAHDLQEIEVQWAVGAGCGETIVSDGEVVAFRGRASGGPDQLAIVEVATGEERARIDLGPTSQEPVRMGDAIALATSRRGVVLVDLATGDDRELGVDGTPLAAADGVLVVWQDTELHAHDVASGEVRWSRPAPEGDGPWTTSAGDALFEADTPTGQLSRLDPATGEPEWTTELNRTSAIDVDVHDGVVFATTSTSTWALDLDTGEPRWWTLTVPDEPTTDD